MNKTRLEAFSDGVLAIIITIMVLEIKMPHGTSWDAMKSILPSLGSYLLSFLVIGIYWGNHHHLLHSLHKVSGKIIWANLDLLFWLSLLPFATKWMADNDFDSASVAIYGGLLVISGLAFSILSNIIAKNQKSDAELTKALQKSKMKANISTALYIFSIPLAFVHPAISCTLFAVVALMWIIPNRDLERLLAES